MWLNQSFQEVEGHTTSYTGLSCVKRPSTIQTTLPFQEILNFPWAMCQLGRLILVCSKQKSLKCHLNILFNEKNYRRQRMEDCNLDYSFQLIVLSKPLANRVSLGDLRGGELLFSNTAWLCMDFQKPRESCIHTVVLLQSVLIQHSFKFKRQHLQQINKKIQQQAWTIQNKQETSMERQLMLRSRQIEPNRS